MPKILLVAVFLLSGPAGGIAGRQELVYPGRKWATRSPEQAGLDAGKLKELSAYAGGFGCVVRGGYMVYTWGDAGRRMDVASAVKPLYTHFLLKAVEEGRLASIDRPVCEVEPALRSLNKRLGYKDLAITWRHLCNQVSCYGVEERPGEAFDYSDYNMALLFDSLFLKLYGTTWERVDEEVLHPKLTDPLQCEDDPTFMAFGTGNRPGRLAMSPRDFARFGLLYLRKGMWKGSRLISAEHVKMAVTRPLPTSIPRTKGKSAEMIAGQRSIGGGNNQCDHAGSYSNAWWVNGIGRDGKRNWPDAPADVYGCFGHGDIRVMVVMPGLDLIVSWNNTKIKGHEKVNHALKLLKDAVVEKKASGGRLVVDTRHRQWLRRQGGRPFFMCGPGDPEGFLYRGKKLADGTRAGDQAELIEKLKQTGANCIYLMAVRSHGGDGDATHNPFVDNRPDKGLNAAVLEQWERWFAAMDESGIVIYLFLYDDSTRVWDTGDVVGPQEKAFIRAIVDKFEHHVNLIWCVAEEYGERLSAARVKNIAAEVRAADDYDHPIAVHKNHGLDFSEFAGDRNIDQFAIQYNVRTADELHEGVVEAWRRAAGRYNLNMSEAADYGEGAEARRKSWACAMGGAYVMILGMDIAGTAESDLEDCGRLVRFFESTNFYEMAPHDELKFAATKYVLAHPPHSYIAYTPQATGDIGLKDMKAGTYSLTWFDCATGTRITQPNVKVAAGSQTWPRPKPIAHEAALYITPAKP
ncbi:MAG: serine hydrolase [Phycisphaerales bacterium]|nr:MAG: serine hydrolase [Phycisphaerales bacterium]